MRIENQHLDRTAAYGVALGTLERGEAPSADALDSGETREGWVSECPVGAEDLADFEEILFKQLSELLDHAGGTITGLVELDPNHADPVDFATFESQRSFLLRIRDRESKLIRKIHQALRRIREGTFGICENCGEDIGIARLRARPVTTLCIQCKREMEAAERRIR